MKVAKLARLKYSWYFGSHLKRTPFVFNHEWEMGLKVNCWKMLFVPKYGANSFFILYGINHDFHFDIGYLVKTFVLNNLCLKLKGYVYNNKFITKNDNILL